MSVTSGGTALKPLSTGGRSSGFAGSAGIEMIFFAAHLLPSRNQVQIEEDRSLRLMTQLTKPWALVGSCAGRSSNTSWCSSPKSISCRCVRLVKSQKCGRLAVLVSERCDVDAPGSAVDGMRAGIAGLVRELRRLDDLDDFRRPRIGFGVENVDARGTQARDHEVASLHMGVRRVRAQT